MKPLKLHSKSRPEDRIQKAVRDMLTIKGWYVVRIIGNKFQSGLPDLYATHYMYGSRWIEIKLPGMKGSKFTPAQQERFPKLCANGSGVWIITAATEDEYKKLFKKYNWWHYLDSVK
jgi:hypothetical protein